MQAWFVLPVQKTLTIFADTTSWYSAGLGAQQAKRILAIQPCCVQSSFEWARCPCMRSTYWHLELDIGHWMIREAAQIRWRDSWLIHILSTSVIIAIFDTRTYAKRKYEVSIEQSFMIRTYGASVVKRGVFRIERTRVRKSHFLRTLVTYGVS